MLSTWLHRLELAWLTTDLLRRAGRGRGLSWGGAQWKPGSTIGTACEQERETQISELRRVLGTGKGRGQQLLESRLEPARCCD